MSYYKKQNDNSIITGNVIYGTDFILDKNTKDQSYDGWKWFESPEEAYSYFAATQNKVTLRQFRLALLKNNINPQMITELLSDNAEGLIEWEYASEISRDHPLVESLGVILNKSEEEINQIFDLAKTL